MAAWQIPLSVGAPMQKLESQADIQKGQLGIQQLANATAIQRQVQQENSLKIQAQQEDRSDDQTFQNLFKSNEGDWDKTLKAATGSLRARNLARYTSDHQNIVKTAHDLASSANLEQKTQFDKIKVQNELLGQAMDAVMKAPDEIKDQVYQDNLAQLQKQGVDTSGFPPQRPSDDVLQAHAATVGYLGKILHNADLAAQEEQRMAQASRAAALARRTDAEEAAKATQRAKAEAAANHLGVTNQAEHDEFMADLTNKHPELADSYKNLGTFNEATQQRIQDMALTPEERVKKVQKEREDAVSLEKAASSGGLSGLVARANDPTIPKEQRSAARAAADELEKRQSNIARSGAGVQGRFDQREADRANDQANKDSTTHETLQTKEADLWAVRQQYGDAIAEAEAAKSNTVKDPKTQKDIPIAQAKVQAELAKNKAMIYQNQAKQLRSKHKWGEFSADQDQGDQGAAPASDKPSGAQVAAPPASLLKEGKDITFKGGKGTWTLRNGVPVRVDKTQ